jgi:hypothetical protein
LNIEYVPKFFLLGLVEFDIKKETPSALLRRERPHILKT